MKTRHIIAAAAFAVVGVQASAAELVTNGTFNTDLSGWTVSGATFSSGAALLDSGTDSLSLTIGNLVANTQYTFDFDYTKTAGPGNAAGWALSNATTQGGAADTFASFQFTALTNTLVITFTGTGSGNKKALIDNVSLTGAVSAVPEPETYAMLMAGLGIVGFVARRRRTR